MTAISTYFLSRYNNSVRALGKNIAKQHAQELQFVN